MSLPLSGKPPITMGDIQRQTDPLERSIYQQYPNNPALRRQKVLEIKQQALETLVERQLILMEFDAQGYQLPEKIVDKQVQERIRDRFGDRLTLTQTLQAQGVTFEAFPQGHQNDGHCRFSYSRECQFRQLGLSIGN